MVRVGDLVYFSSDAAFAVDHELRVVAWNRHAEEFLGYRAQEVVGRFCYAVLQAILPDGQVLCTPHCQAELCFGHCQPYAIRSCLGRHKDGQWVNLSLSSMAIPRTAQDDGIVAVVFFRPLEASDETPAPEAMLRLFTLGRFNMGVGDKGIPFYKWERKQALTLLKYLITHRGHVVHRERLIECLWPGAAEHQGRERLKVTVYSLRRELRRAGVQEQIIETVDEAYILRREGIWMDADAFEALIKEGYNLERQHKAKEALRRYQKAEDLYRGDYMEEDRYADWCAEERERLKELHLDMLGRMAELYAAHGEYAQAAQVCRKVLVREPCRESFHRALMEYLWHQGRRDEALVQFHHCRQVLANELDVEPMPETQHLYQQILQSPQEKASVTSSRH
ncbi:MAG: BTAD domain-containing putative transcriptional regulator [Candidatus Bipolaricaulia bacterium]